MKLKRLFEEMTTKPVEYKLDKNKSDFIYSFKINNLLYKVVIATDGKVEIDKGDLLIKPYEITFGIERDGEVHMGTSKTGNANLVFATVYDILKNFLNKNKVDVLYFSAIKDQGERSSRSALYKRAIQKLNMNDYWTRHFDIQEGESYYFIINKNKIKENDKNINSILKYILIGTDDI